MRKIILVSCMVCIALAGPAVAATLRGRVVGQHAYSPNSFPVNGARVDLYERVGDKWRIVYTAFTGSDGVYYMKNVKPGSYYLQINRRNNYRLDVGHKEYQGVPAVVVRY